MSIERKINDRIVQSKRDGDLQMHGFWKFVKESFLNSNSIKMNSFIKTCLRKLQQELAENLEEVNKPNKFILCPEISVNDSV